MAVMHEIDTLQGGLTDTIKAIAEELEIKPAVLKKAIEWHTRPSLARPNKIKNCWKQFLKLWARRYKYCFQQQRVVHVTNM
jgi:hypothetical protein